MKRKIVITVDRDNEMSMSVKGFETHLDILNALIYSLAYKVCVYKRPGATKDELFTATASALCTEIYDLFKELYPNTHGQLTENVTWELVNE